MNIYNINNLDLFLRCPYMYYNSLKFNLTGAQEYYGKCVEGVVNLFLDKKLNKNKKSEKEIKDVWDASKINAPDVTHKKTYNDAYEHMLANFVSNIYKKEDIDILGARVPFVLDLETVIIEGTIPLLYSKYTDGIIVSLISYDYPSKTPIYYKKNPLYMIYSEAFRRKFLDKESMFNIITLDIFKTIEIELPDGKERYDTLREIVEITNAMGENRGDPEYKYCTTCKYKKVCTKTK